MQHILCSKERGKRLGALVMTLVMVFFAMTAAVSYTHLTLPTNSLV